MGTETDVVESEEAKSRAYLETRTKVKKVDEVSQDQTDEVVFGVRTLMTSPLPACDKLDKMFGSGGEAIVHHMWFESGQNLFENMVKHNTSIRKEELLKGLVNAQPRLGWGDLSIKIIRSNPPTVDITVKNSPVKTLKGSQKYLIGSFWAGVLSRYFNSQLVCRNFSYTAEKDEFQCTITI